MRTTTLAELMSSPTSRKNGIASRASLSIPSNIFWMMVGNVTSVKNVPTSTPAISENATGTPVYPNSRKRNVISARIKGALKFGLIADYY